MPVEPRPCDQHQPSFGRRVPVGRLLLENGTEEKAKSECGRSRERPHLSIALRTDNNSQSVLVPAGRRAQAPKPALKIGRRVALGRSEISMESLILAQDERWRRA